ncbi:MAG: hypothetical protein GY805_38910 [Chloroflexi bacterium]|nr:hypothetical protein [Chloroflexota bacterium]
METVYIVGIIAVAIVLTIIVVVWLLRSRITSGRFKGSATEQSVEAEIQASAPQNATAPPISTPAPPPSQQPPDVDISGNWMIGTNVIRVWRDKARVSYNKLLGKQQIEVKESPVPAQPKKRRKKKKRKK